MRLMLILLCALPAGAQVIQMDLRPRVPNCTQVVTDEDSYRLVRLSDLEIEARDSLLARSAERMLAWVKSGGSEDFNQAMADNDREADGLVAAIMGDHGFSLHSPKSGGFLMPLSTDEGKDEEGNLARFEMRGNFLLVVNYSTLPCAATTNEMDSLNFTARPREYLAPP